MHPILFELPFVRLPVYAYGTMLYLSLLAGWMLTLRLAEQDGIPRGRARICFLVTALAALLGARLLFVVTNLGAMRGIADIFDIASGGLVAYGGFLGGLAGAMACCRLVKAPLLVWADCAAPSLCIGLVLTRIGCLLAGCDFGAPSHLPWAIHFPPGSPAFEAHVARGWIAGGALSSLPVHPTQIYEAGAGLGLLAIVLLVRRARYSAGEALAAFGMGYGVVRAMIEIVRADPQRGWVGPLSTSQFIGLVTAAAALVLVIWLRRSTAPRIAWRSASN
jgi:phosphatidylglycerol---prolipoprotein diacylglyceryl transferase